MAYVRKHYGNLTELKKAFGVTDLSRNWTTEKVKEAISQYIQKNGRIRYEDLNNSNGVPSITAIRSLFPQYNTFNEFMKAEFHTAGKKNWDEDSTLAAGREYVSKHGDISQKDLCAANNLPSVATVNRIFGSLSKYQTMTGSTVKGKNALITKDMIRDELDKYFLGGDRIIKSQYSFFSSFVYSPTTIYKRYGDFKSFCKEERITVLAKRLAEKRRRDWMFPP